LASRVLRALFWDQLQYFVKTTFYDMATIYLVADSYSVAIFYWFFKIIDYWKKSK
jgi:hypothetical protein